MLKITKYISIIGLLLAIGLNSCTERIDIDLDGERIRLVVEGSISDIQGNQYVKLTETADYFSNTPPKGVAKASVMVSNGDESIFLDESQEIEGLYLFPDNYLGVQGKTYDLNISLASEVGGYSDYSAQTIMPPLSDEVDSIAVEWMPQFESWVIRLYAQDPPREDFYMFNALINGVLVTDSIHKVNISDDKLFNGNYTNGVMVMFFGEDELIPGDIFTLVLSNITQEYASFVNELQTEIQPSVPLFSGPPANVSSNITNNAAGWFTAFPSNFTSTVVKPTE